MYINVFTENEHRKIRTIVEWSVTFLKFGSQTNGPLIDMKEGCTLLYSNKTFCNTKNKTCLESITNNNILLYQTQTESNNTKIEDEG